MSYDEFLHYRDEDIDGEGHWLWVKSDGGPDGGAWQGPKDDWVNTHKEAYLKYLKKQEVVITAGANCGMYTRHFANLFDVVYAFEPDPLNFHCMVNNTQFDNVVKIQAGLGSRAGFALIDRPTMLNVGCHRIVPNKDGIIPVMTIDQFGFEDVDLLQLDVEGFEREVLLGAKETILKTRPVVSVERDCGGPLLLELGYTKKEQVHFDSVYVFE